MQALPSEGSRSTRALADDEIFVGNLSFFCAEQDLFDLFSRFVSVRETRVMKKDKGRRSLLFGFVRFNSRFDAVQMVRLFNGHLFMGRRMKVELSAEKQGESKPEEGFQVHVVLSSTFSSSPHERRVLPTEEFLYKVLLVFGFITDVSIKEYSAFSNRQQGYGFVTFEQESSMHEAIARCQNWLVDGVTISCTPARDMLRHNNNNNNNSHSHPHAQMFSHASHAHANTHSTSNASYGVPPALPLSLPAHLSFSAHAQRTQSSSPSLFFPDVPPFPAHYLHNTNGNNNNNNNNNNANNFGNFNNGSLSSRSFSRRQDQEQAYSPRESLSVTSASMPLSARSHLTTSSHNSRLAEDRLSSFHSSVSVMTGDAQEREREDESERERDSRLFSSFLPSSHNIHAHSLAHNNAQSQTPSLAQTQTQTQTRALPLTAYPSAPPSLFSSSLSAPPSLSLSSHSSSSVQRSVFPLSDDHKHFYE